MNSSADDRYVRAAKLERLGPDFANNPNLEIPLSLMSDILKRADELRRANPPKPPISPAELIRHWRILGPQDLNVFLQFLADRIYDSRLSDGRNLRDAMDFKLWLEELGEEVRK